jgi:heat shock protein HslJ
MKGMLTAALAVTAMAGCATMSEEAADTNGAGYRALGTEPFWSVTIGGGRMVFDTPEGGFSVVAPAPRTTFNGRRYETARLTVDITHGECSDGMSDRRYADTVRVTADGRELSGCGGDILPPAALAGTSWAIVAIGGEAVSGELYHLSFTSERMSGQAGCNRFTGDYRVSGDTLTVGALAMTRMACVSLDGATGRDPMAHERRFGEIVSGPVRVSFPNGDTLVLTGANGEIRLRRAI